LIWRKIVPTWPSLVPDVPDKLEPRGGGRDVPPAVRGATGAVNRRVAGLRNPRRTEHEQQDRYK
jgi:hypothetical protein